MASTHKTLSPIDKSVRVSKNIEIQSVQLVETVAKLGVIQSPMGIELNCNAKTIGIPKEAKVQVEVTFDLVARPHDQQDVVCLRIHAKYLLQYGLRDFDGIEQEHLDSFGRLNGIHNAWSYWREYVQSITTRMGIPALTVPVFNPLGSATATISGGSVTNKPKKLTKKHATNAKTRTKKSSTKKRSKSGLEI